MPVRSPALHIGVDARELVGKPTGVGRYLLGILQAWARDPEFPHRVTLFLPGAPPPAVTALGPRFASQVEAATRAGTWWEQTRLPRAAAKARIDILFAAGYTAPLRLACPQVLAVYDVSYFAHPEWFGWREGARRRWFTRASARRSAGIITISEFSAREIVRWLGVARDRVHLAPPGAPRVPVSANAPAREPIVLFVGSLLNRRRLPELLDGFALTASRVSDARLVLVGDNRTHPRLDVRALAAERGIDRRVEWREYATEDELNRLYATARVFAFLSDYEGFAMTPLEAAAQGTPAVLLDTPIAREVYGDGALLVPPDPARIADTLTTLLTNDEVHARTLAAARVRLGAYSWDRSAATICRVLEQAVRR